LPQGRAAGTRRLWSLSVKGSNGTERRPSRPPLCLTSTLGMERF
jgi:hypothetical protein